MFFFAEANKEELRFEREIGDAGMREGTREEPGKTQWGFFFCVAKELRAAEGPKQE